MELSYINLLTHNDLDGAACAIVAEYCARKLNVPCKVTMTSNADIANRFEDWAKNIDLGASTWKEIENQVTGKSKPKGSLNIISDLSLNGELSAKFMDIRVDDIEYDGMPQDQVIRSTIIVDHHIDSVENKTLEMVNYECAVSITDNTGFECKTCGALLLWKYFREYFQLDIDELYEFVNIVRDWDTHQYAASLNPLSRKFNLLYFQMGYGWFRDFVIGQITHGRAMTYMDPTIKTLCDRLAEAIDIEVRRRMNPDMWGETTIAGTPVRFHRCDNRAVYSDLGAAASERYNCIVMMFDSFGQVSFRSSGNLDCHRIAKVLGGGGHKNAAGCYMTRSAINDVIRGNFKDVATDDT